MIFSFTEEEKELIRDFEKKARAQGITSEDLKRSIADVEENGEDELKICYEERPKENLINSLCNEFEEMLNNFENSRFSKLDNQTKIIENAKNTAKEAIIFSYNDFSIITESNKDFKVSGFTYETKNYFYVVLNYGSDKLINQHIEKEKSPARIFERDGMRTFLLQYALKRHIEALRGTPGETKLYRAIDKFINKSKYIVTEALKGNFAIYEEKTPIYHGSYIDYFADVTKREQIRSIENGKVVIISEEEGKEYIFKISSPKGHFGITTNKLLLASGAEFTKINNFPYEKGNKINYLVKIPLKAYAERCGYDITEHPKATPQEREKEKARAQGKLKDARKQIKKDLELLFDSSFSWSEKIKGHLEDFVDVRLISAKGIKDGYIIVEFTRTYAEYLLIHPALTQFDNRLLLIDGNHKNAYYLGLKIAEHNYNYKNQERGTANILKVKTLLENVNLTSIKEIKAQNASWQGRIKEPLENILDYLVSDIKLLSDWKYTKAKGEELTAAEAAAITDFAIYEKLYVTFSVNKNEEDN